MAKALIALLKQSLPGVVLESHSQHGDETVVVEAARWHEVAAFLKTSPAADMSMLTDLTAVDYPDRLPRFEIVAHYYSLSLGHRLRVKTRAGDAAGRAPVRVPVPKRQRSRQSRSRGGRS